MCSDKTKVNKNNEKAKKLKVTKNMEKAIE